jgi:hypothetical protein
LNSFCSAIAVRFCIGKIRKLGEKSGSQEVGKSGSPEDRKSESPEESQ